MAKLAQLGELEQLAQLGKLGKLVELLARDKFARRTELVVIQGTPFCNIDCRYCYLPDRNNARRISLDTVEAGVRWLVECGLAADRLTVVWHSGEPLVLKPDWYVEAFERCERAAGRVSINQAFQTNGILIDEEWCDLFKTFNIRLGISIDGPAVIHDVHRQTRKGGGTHKRVMEGVAKLKSANVPFHAIAVVTAATLCNKELFIDFFEELEPTELGINFEEKEGFNVESSLGGVRDNDIKHFLRYVVDRIGRTGKPRLREFERILSAIRSEYFDRSFTNQENTPFRIVTIDVDGGIHTFSPELASIPSGGFDGKALGNVRESTLADILQSTRFSKMAGDIELGVDRCLAECPYFCLCGGGSPSNKIAETGSFSSTETDHCRVSIKQVADAVLARIEADLAV